MTQTLYGISENAKFFDGIRDLTAIRKTGFAKIFARDAVFGKKTVFGRRYSGKRCMSEVRDAGYCREKGAGMRDQDPHPPFQTLSLAVAVQCYCYGMVFLYNKKQEISLRLTN